MKYLKRLSYVLPIFVLCVIFAMPVHAEEQDDLKIYPDEAMEMQYSGMFTYSMASSVEAVSSNLTSSEELFPLLKSFEGFSAYKVWDVSRYSIGYGSSWEDCVELFGEDCEPITEEQGQELVRGELSVIEAVINNFLSKNGIVVNQHQFDALIDFTYNVGVGWTTYQNSDGSPCLLKRLLLSGKENWTFENVEAALAPWVYAGGQKLEGLVRRRAAEAELFMAPPDVSSLAWYYSDVMKAYKLGLVHGTDTGLFLPDDNLTRAQVVILLANLAGADLSPVSSTTFDDVAPNSWYASAVEWASNAGYVNGYGDGNFGPDDLVTREQLCMIFYNYYGGNASNESGRFADDDLISGWAKNAVYYCQDIGLIYGVGENNFAPQNHANRAQAAAIFLRAYNMG